MTAGPRLLVAMPALNEADTVARVIGAIPRSLPGIGSVHIVVVDDGSSDDTAAHALAAGADVVVHPARRGLAAAFASIVRYARTRGFDLLCTLDADGQHDPADIGRVVAPLVEGRADFVTGSRLLLSSAARAMPRMRRFGNVGMGALVSQLAGLEVHDVSCGLRAMSHRVFDALEPRDGLTYTHDSLWQAAALGARVLEVPVHARYFAGRDSRVARSLVRYGYGASALLFARYCERTRHGRPRALLAFGWMLTRAVTHALVTDARALTAWRAPRTWSRRAAARAS